MRGVYYNEYDPYAADWLENLIRAGHLPEGEVDRRSIVDVRPDDLRGFVSAHFFAGIGGWPYALRLAGWPDDRSVWTGSCPCQPFSAAGKRSGFDDERHLWPAFFGLIRECRPAVVFGEQVASKDGLGWLDAVRADMEGADYALAAVDLCAAGVGAPHIRQRLWFVGLADAERHGQHGRGNAGPGRRHELPDGGAVGGLGDGIGAGLEGHAGHGDGTGGWPVEAGPASASGGAACGGPRPTNGFWRDPDWLHCRDGKWRPVEPGTFPLAHGVSGRVGRLRGYGNAIVPQVAQAVIESVMEIIHG